MVSPATLSLCLLEQIIWAKPFSMCDIWKLISLHLFIETMNQCEKYKIERTQVHCV